MHPDNLACFKYRYILLYLHIPILIFPIMIVEHRQFIDRHIKPFADNKMVL